MPDRSEINGRIRALADDLCEAKAGWSHDCRVRRFGRHCRDCIMTAIVRVHVQELGARLRARITETCHADR